MLAETMIQLLSSFLLNDAAMYLSLTKMELERVSPLCDLNSFDFSSPCQFDPIDKGVEELKRSKDLRTYHQVKPWHTSRGRFRTALDLVGPTPFGVFLLK
jgi:hypothetical protein